MDIFLGGRGKRKLARLNLLESGGLIRCDDGRLRGWVPRAVRHLTLVLLLLVERIDLLCRDLLPRVD